MKIITGFFLCLILDITSIFGQNFTEILGRPTNNSVTISILFDQQAEVFWEYGTSPGVYQVSTETFITKNDTALETDFINLVPDTRYYYRTRYRPLGSSNNFSAGAEHTFHTSRTAGSAFTFAVEADPHLDTNSNTAAYALTLQNILSSQPDFMIDLGDNFMSEKLKVKNQPNITSRHLLFRSYFGATCHSVPLFLVKGNHEGENGWSLDGTPGCLPILATNTRKLFFPNPVSNDFYSGNTNAENYVGLMQNYYSWEWGNALFIVLDPYWYTTSKPGWGWTLGEDQYNWFKNVITGSHARFKFVFSHQLVGGNGNDARGGSEFAGFYENGGENADLTWGFDTYRPGWEKPIHSLMVENHTNIFFHGHDHCYAKQDKDGLVYQEVPQPSSRNITNITGLQYGYVDGILLPGRGFLLVTVTDSTAKVDYIKTYLPNETSGTHTNGEVAHSYTLRSTVSAIEEKNEVTGSFILEQNYPNPFSSGTEIRYEILAANHVRIKVFDMLGRELMTLVNRYQQPGNYSVPFNPGELSAGGGIYYCAMTAGNDLKTMKMICIK